MTIGQNPWNLMRGVDTIDKFDYVAHTVTLNQSRKRRAEIALPDDSDMDPLSIANVGDSVHKRS